MGLGSLPKRLVLLTGPALLIFPEYDNRKTQGTNIINYIIIDI